MDLDDATVGIGQQVAAGDERGCRGGPVDGQTQPQRTSLPIRTGRVDLENGAVAEDGGVVPGPLAVLFGGELQPEVAVADSKSLDMPEDRLRV